MVTEEDIGKLARIPAFAALEVEALRLIVYSAERRVLRAGDVLFRRGERSTDGLILLDGSIALDASGEGAAAARIVRPPALIGEFALLAQTQRPATAIAREPSTVLRVSRQLFQRVLGEFPASAERLKQSLSGQLQQLAAELGTLRNTHLAVTDEENAS